LASAGMASVRNVSSPLGLTLSFIHLLLFLGSIPLFSLCNPGAMEKTMLSFLL